MRRLVLAFLCACLCLTAACTSWNHFWEEADKKSDNSGSTTTTADCATQVASDTLAMVCVPTASSFAMGYIGVATPVTTILSITAFSMAKYEVQYGDWFTVKTWATSNGYTFANPGVQGDNGAHTNQHPVTTINWRDAIVWCNAASEKQGLTPVYYSLNSFITANVLRDTTTLNSPQTGSGQVDNPYVNWSANGYRLPTEAEWEYAARYVSAGVSMRGDAPSGWQDTNTANGLVDDPGEYDPVAWYTPNSSSATHPVGQKTANALDIYDMSGNVWEWTWDWNVAYPGGTQVSDYAGPTTGTIRVIRGGSFNNPATDLRGAVRFSNVPWGADSSIGFRPVRRP